MNPLTDADLASLEASLKRDRDEVMARIDRQMAGRDADQVRTLVNHLEQGDSRAAAATLNDEELALLQSELRLLAELDAALQRLQFGNGGLCIACGKPIPLVRLKALPAAAKCLHCQVLAEETGRYDSTGAP